MTSEPLVSVGIPTYNRPTGLRKTLECIASQTYSNLEIIISDNASPNPQVKEVALEFASSDPRIQYYRQADNYGAAFNFKYVLKHAQGEYFMWAADDDVWDDFYIEELVRFLSSPLAKQFVAANFEAQYTDENGKRFEFFAEGARFYEYQTNIVTDRLRHLLKFNYGNIIYSLYRRETLLKDDLVFVQNEIPFLLQIINQGNWKIFPKVGFYKKTTFATYTQARWEMEGGYLGVMSNYHLFWRLFRFIPNMRQLRIYHKEALQNIYTAIDSLSICRSEISALKGFARCLMWKHLFQLSFGYKRKAFV